MEYRNQIMVFFIFCFLCVTNQKKKHTHRHTLIHCKTGLCVFWRLPSSCVRFLVALEMSAFLLSSTKFNYFLLLHFGHYFLYSLSLKLGRPYNAGLFVRLPFDFWLFMHMVNDWIKKNWSIPFFLSLVFLNRVGRGFASRIKCDIDAHMHRNKPHDYLLDNKSN